MPRAPGLLRSLFRRLARAPATTLPPLEPIPREKLRALERRLNYRIHDKAVFIQALQHRSFHQRSQHPSRSNERLEFLGDSVLNLIVGEILYHRYPRLQEGELTKLRSRLVNRKALASYARELSLSEFILMEKGRRRSPQIRSRRSLLRSISTGGSTRRGNSSSAR
jgi:ribonuclease-3